MKNLLLYRLLILYTCALAALAWAWMLGLVAPIFATDVSYLSYATAGLFVVVTMSLFVRAAKAGSVINDLKNRNIAVSYLRRRAAKLTHKNAHIFHAAGFMQLLGLLGTVIGFYVTIGGIEGGDNGVVVSGLRTAIGTTILGGFLSLLTYMGSLMLDTATACLGEDIK